MESLAAVHNAGMNDFPNGLLDYRWMRRAKSLIQKIDGRLAQPASELTGHLAQRQFLIIMNFSALQAMRLVQQVTSSVSDKFRIQCRSGIDSQCTHQRWIAELNWPGEDYR